MDVRSFVCHVAFALQPITRAERADNARQRIQTNFTDKQQAFLDFVLSQYVKEGLEELDQEKLSPLLKLKYNNVISDATIDLGDPSQIRSVFVGFQKYQQERECEPPANWVPG